MFRRAWQSITLVNKQQVHDMMQLYNTCRASIGAFDTETTGLHIKLDKPFVFQFGFLDPRKPMGYTYLVDLERQPEFARWTISTWQSLATLLKIYLGHNVKFDLHMMENIGLPYTVENVSDTMFYIRYAHDALTPANGGPPLGLKDYASRYIDGSAKTHEKRIDQERTAIAKELNLKLKRRLSICGVPPEKYGARSYTLGVIDQMFKDSVFGIEDLTGCVRDQYLRWYHEDLPDVVRSRVQGIVASDNIPYTLVNREVLYEYAHVDIVLTLETYEQTAIAAHARENMQGVYIEDSLVFPLLEMENVGFKADVQYLKNSQARVKSYILQQRKVFWEMAEQELKVGQHEKILELLQTKYNVDIGNTNSDTLDLVKSELMRNSPDHPAIPFINVLQELRTLEKWYSTYIMRFLSDLQRTDRLYTQINQVGTVSGRVTSDFQQFPKEAIRTQAGEELFHPRKLVIPSGGEYNGLVYLDYSQIELRFQAFYTILVGHPDLNLCRAYMPYECINERGEKFDYNNPKHIQAASTEVWFLVENPGQRWVPTDVHAATTVVATGVQPNDPEFKKLRSEIGKHVNFAKNYRAQRPRIRQMFPFKTEEEITRINDAYYIAFPGVKKYHEYCDNRAQQNAWTPNLFGIKYYGVSGHKLTNLLIQGSAAFYLKQAIRELYDYSKANGVRSLFQMNIHDELSWEKHSSELSVFFAFQKIMEDWEDTLVPIVADMSVSTTNWADKKEVSSLDEIRLHFRT